MLALLDRPSLIHTYMSLFTFCQLFVYLFFSDINSVSMSAGVNGRTYGGGGYILELRGYIDDLQNKIKLLQQVKWTDNRTRSLILEFSSYNAQVNIYRFVYIVQIFTSPISVNIFTIYLQIFYTQCLEKKSYFLAL